MRRSSVVLTLLACVAVSGSAGAAPSLSLPIEEHTLPNGMHVRLAPDPSLDDVTVMVRYDVGSSDDPAGKDGLAHLTEHMMFEGSKHVPRGEHFRAIQRVGGSGVNASTSLDQTTYFATVPPEALPLVFWLESDRMGFPLARVDRTSLAHQRELVADELRDKVEDRALGTLADVAAAEVFPSWHPYHRDHDARWLGDITLDDVRAFLRTWYTPRNATLVVAGHFDPTRALALAAQYFGDLPSPAPPSRPPVPTTWASPGVRVDMAAGMTRDAVLLAWPAPALDQAGDAELDLAAAILTDPHGRLQGQLLRGGLVTQVGSREVSHLRASSFVVSATVADGKSPDDVVRVVESTVRAMGQGVGADECERARAEWAETQLGRIQTSAGRASWIAGNPFAHEPWDLGKYARLGPAEVSAAVQRFLVSTHPAVVVVHHDRRYPFHGVVLSRTDEGT